MTTVGGAGYSSQQPAQYMPNMQNIPVTTRVWGTTGNTDTVIDASVHPNSVVVISWTTARSGTGYYVTVSQGQFIVTSSDSESATTTSYNYRIL